MSLISIPSIPGASIKYEPTSSCRSWFRFLHWVNLIFKEPFFYNMTPSINHPNSTKGKSTYSNIEGKNQLCQRLSSNTVFSKEMQGQFLRQVQVIFVLHDSISISSSGKRLHSTYNRSNWSEQRNKGFFEISFVQSLLQS